MKRFVFILAILVCGVATAHTINWHDGNTTTQTTCSAGDNITPPTPIGKYGYLFKGWMKMTPIEYLESTGTQYIDTEVITNNNLIRIDVDIRCTDTSKLFYFCSSGNDWSSGRMVGLGISYGSWSMILPGSSYNIFGTASTNRVRLSWTITPDGKSEVTGDLNKSTTNSNYFGPNLIWRQDTWDLMKGSYIDFYTCKIYLNNTLVRDFIPVLDPYGTPCMYDKVEKKFYYNAGTGQFIAGPVVSE